MKVNSLVTFVYIPGCPGLAHPSPQETIPTKVLSIANGPPESPYKIISSYYKVHICEN